MQLDLEESGNAVLQMVLEVCTTAAPWMGPHPDGKLGGIVLFGSHSSLLGNRHSRLDRLAEYQGVSSAL